MAAPTAYGSSQAGGLIGAVAARLYHSHSHARSELLLRPTPQLTATLDRCDPLSEARDRTCAHFTDEETKASGEETCPRLPKIKKVSSDMELGPSS